MVGFYHIDHRQIWSLSQSGCCAVEKVKAVIMRIARVGFYALFSHCAGDLKMVAVLDRPSIHSTVAISVLEVMLD